jgi:endo-1,4-beta-xylanase
MIVLAGSHAGCGPDESSSPTPNPIPGPSPVPNPEPPPSLPQPFRQLAARCGVKVGPAVAYSPLVGEPVYGDTLGREFNILTPENDMKWSFIHPQRSQYTFDRVDAIVAFAASHDMVVHGHTLVWHNQNPSWLTSNPFSRDEMTDILRDHISTVVGRFAGRYLTAWDVVNEGVNDDGTLRRTVWLDRIGTDYMDLAFRFANQADPTARLIYNDYGNETTNAKSDGIYTLLSGMRSRGVPVHGVGLQMHLPMSGIDVQSVAQNMQRFAALGLEIYVTEMDVRVPTPATSASLATQADVYRGVLNACLGQPACKAFQTWGFTDAYSWIPGSYPGFGAALIFDERYQPKPAYDSLEVAMSRCVPR